MHFLTSPRKYDWLLILSSSLLSNYYSCFAYTLSKQRGKKQWGSVGNKERLKIIKEQSTIPCIFSGCVYQKRALLSLIFNEMHEPLHGLVAYANKSTL